jgi:tetratricopeptide (TPR) repeat protein
VILNKSNINKRLFDQQGFKESEMLEFKEIIGMYPYASVFAIAYLRGLKKMEHIQFEEELHHHAFKIANRHLLYQLVMQTEDTIEVEAETEAEIETEAETEAVAVTEAVAETVVETETEAERVVEAVEVAETVAETETEAETEAEAEVKVEAEELIDSGPQTTERVDTELETLINASAATTTFIHEFNQQSAEVDPELPKNELLKESRSLPSQAEIENTPKSFNQWLALGEKTNNPELETEKTTMIPMEKPKREFYSPSKKAKESIDSNKMPVSETLAKIFVLQGNYPKAIYVYEQLIIIYPKKKSIFASQIKQLSNKLIN